jgi:hypothetical protein
MLQALGVPVSVEGVDFLVQAATNGCSAVMAWRWCMLSGSNGSAPPMAFDSGLPARTASYRFPAGYAAA